MRLTPLAAFAATAILTARASSGAGEVEDLAQTPTPEPTVGKYEQTWTTPYGETTCDDWHNAMDDHERFVMSGDILVSLWRDAGSEAFPEDPVIETYANGIGTACKGAGEDLELKVTEVAVLLYNTATDIKPPD